jgi:copper homeostasis protein
MEVGGTTPALRDIAEVRALLHIDLNVMIRPRGGDFVYSEEEFAQMKQEVTAIKAMGVDGLVFGVLNADNTIDVQRNRELLDLAAPLPCTFHRAFDAVLNKEHALEDVIQCGFTTILTSGCELNVDFGLNNLIELVRLASDRITIMPGGGLRSTNIADIASKTGTHYFHSSAITDGSDTAVAEEVKALKACL